MSQKPSVIPHKCLAWRSGLFSGLQLSPWLLPRNRAGTPIPQMVKQRCLQAVREMCSCDEREPARRAQRGWNGARWGCRRRRRCETAGGCRPHGSTVPGPPHFEAAASHAMAQTLSAPSGLLLVRVMVGIPIFLWSNSIVAAAEHHPRSGMDRLVLGQAW